MFLIKEELKSCKLFDILEQAVITDCHFQPHLDELILSSMGMNDQKDETFTLYNTIMEKRSRKIKAGNSSAMKQALKVYMELREVKRKLVTHP
ncbi:MAG TPA: hypothetical protein VGK59_18455 [Ohtaekwangia sp.]